MHCSFDTEIVVKSIFSSFSHATKKVLRLNVINVTKNNVFGNIHANIDFTKDLSWRNEFGIDYTNAEESQFTPTEGDKSNKIQFIERQNMYWRFASTLNYGKQIKKHRFGAMLGYEAWKSTWSGYDMTKSNLMDDKLYIDKDYQNVNPTHRYRQKH